MLLGAHHGEPCLVRALDEPAGPGGELLRLHVIRIAAKRFVPQSRVPRIRSRPAEAAERPALPLIADAVLGKPTLQRNPIELGMAARAGMRAHVNQQLDTGAPEHGGQLFHGARTVADGPDFHRVHETGVPEGYCPNLAGIPRSGKPYKGVPLKVPGYFAARFRKSTNVSGSSRSGSCNLVTL